MQASRRRSSRQKRRFDDLVHLPRVKAQYEEVLSARSGQKHKLPNRMLSEILLLLPQVTISGTPALRCLHRTLNLSYMPRMLLRISQQDLTSRLIRRMALRPSSHSCKLRQLPPLSSKINLLHIHPNGLTATQYQFNFLTPGKYQ